MTDEPMELDDQDVQVSEQQADETKVIARQGDQSRPYCRTHFVLMRASTSGDVTRYKCPVPGCKAVEKKARPRSVIPNVPMECPHCAGKAESEKKKNAKPVYLEVDYDKSTASQLQMVCPTSGCGFSIKVARPDLATRAPRLRSRENAESDISAR